MIKAVIYDMDNLMINSYPLAREATETVVKELGYDLNKIPKELLEAFVGMRMVDIFQEIVDYFNIKVKVEDLERRRDKILFKAIKEKLEPLPGLFKSLEMFRNKGFKIALVSSGRKKYIDIVLKKFKLTKYFEVIVSGDSVKKGKPDPEPYMKAVKELQVKPEECVVLEDAREGVKSAKSAGCKCIGIINKRTPPQDLSKADIILNSLNDVTIKLIKSL